MHHEAEKKTLNRIGERKIMEIRVYERIMSLVK